MMFDFLKIASRAKKNGVTEVFPKFVMKKSTDLMIRGGDFYAIWIEENKKWSTDEDDVITMIDRELTNYAKELEKKGIICEPIRTDEFTGGKATFFKDPDGMPLEIHE